MQNYTTPTVDVETYNYMRSSGEYKRGGEALRRTDTSRDYYNNTFFMDEEQLMQHLNRLRKL